MVQIRPLVVLVCVALTGCATSPEHAGARPSSRPDATAATAPSAPVPAKPAAAPATPVTSSAAPAPADPPVALGLSGVRFVPQPGWVAEETATSMRAAQYGLPGPAGDASLVVFYFGPASAGSIDANIDRWLGQLEQPDGRSTREVAAIGTRSVRGLEVHTVDAGGTYVAETMPGSGERLHEPDHHLLAAIVRTEAGPYYIKLVGPAATVARWRGSWETMLASLAPAAAPSGAAGAGIEHP